jgi:endoglucanase
MALSPNTSVSQSFANAASSTGQSGLNTLYTQAIAKNSWLASSTTRGAFGQVISALGAQGVMVILDNQVSKASWCCSQTDGNGWFKSGAGDADSQYFDVNNWMAGLKAMATFAKTYPNVVGMSLRNEMRPTSDSSATQAVWATNVKAGAAAIYAANSNLLIVIGGLNYALDLSWLYSSPLDRSSFPNRVVWEFHWCTCYDNPSIMRLINQTDSWSYSSTDCTTLKTNIGNSAGYLLTQNKSYTGPLWVRSIRIRLLLRLC